MSIHVSAFDEKKLTRYGIHFQNKVVALLLFDKKFLRNIVEILTPDSFDSDANKWIVTFIKKYFIEYKELPTLEIFKIEIVDNIKDELFREIVINQLRAIVLETENSSGDVYIKEKFTFFCKLQNFKRTVVSISEIIETCDNEIEVDETKFDKILGMTQKAHSSGADLDLGLDFKNDINKIFDETKRNPILTPWNVINEITNGGLGSGELGIAMGPSGAGKSWFLVNLGYHAIMNGVNVVHYTLELDDVYTGVRYASKLSGYPSAMLKYHVDEIKKDVSDIRGGLIIKKYKQRISTLALGAHFESVLNYGIKPGLVVVDYGDLMKSGRTYVYKEKRHELEDIYEDLRNFASEYEVPTWTVSQVNRSGIKDEFIDADKIAEAYAKIFTCDFVMSLSRGPEDKVNNTARWLIVKNRFGPDGIKLFSDMNAATGVINIHSPNTAASKDLEKLMKDDNLVKKELKKRLEYMNDE